jgi:hypothetical protein
MDDNSKDSQTQVPAPLNRGAQAPAAKSNGNFQAFPFMRTLFIRVSCMTAACFAISYGAAKATSAKPYPKSLVDAYSDVGSKSQPVQFTKVVGLGGANELEIRTTAVDIEVVEQKTEPAAESVEIALQGKFSTLEPLHVSVEGRRMVIVVDEHPKRGSFFDLNFDFTSESGHLRVALPKNLRALQLRSTSGDVSVTQVHVDQIEAKTVSGALSILNQSQLLPSSAAKESGLAKESGPSQDPATTRTNGKTALSMILQSVSGDVELQGAANSVKVNTVSGDVSLAMEATPLAQYEIKTTSGDVDVTFSEQPQLDLEFNSVSGTATIERGLGVETSADRSLSTHLGQGKENGKMNVKTVSGDFKMSRE